MDELLEYLNSLYAIQILIAVQSHEQILELSNRLVKAWGDRESKNLFQWPLHMRVLRIDENY